MRKLFVATVAAFVLLTGSAFAKDEKPNYFDKTEYACDNDIIAEHLKALYADDSKLTKPQVLYVKGAAEVSRNEDGLKCKITMVHSRGRINGFMVYKYEEGHSIFGFRLR